MSQQLVSRSPDLKRLRDEGYEIEVNGGCLITHQIPYLDKDKNLRRGTLVSNLDLANDFLTSKPKSHVMYFIGDAPHDHFGQLLNSVYYSPCPKKQVGKLFVDHMLSNKPSEGYPNYYDKIVNYINLISFPAMYIFPDAKAKTFKVINENLGDSVFNYIDTNSSRANIDYLNSKLDGQKIAIVGLGGTGSYILDFVAKTNVEEIHLYDNDLFLQHNAFRAPGACSVEDLNEEKSKVDYLNGIYSKMRKNIFSHKYHILEDNLNELDGMSFVFLCADNNKARYMIASHLIRKEIPFVDVGLGVNEGDDCLTGQIRTTSFDKRHASQILETIPAEINENNDYATNIQIAELNALNACFAVIKWKKICGFYADPHPKFNSVYNLTASIILNEND